MVEPAADLPPILEHDPDPTAIIEPTNWHKPIPGLPEGGLLTWMPDAFDRLLQSHPSKVCHHVAAETAQVEIRTVELPEGPITAALSHVGAPVTTILFEAMLAIGVSRTVAVGSAGGLVAEHPPGTVVVPDRAIRDEGVSYHYVPAGRHAEPDPALQAKLHGALVDAGLPVVRGDVWTTDALFRETAAKVARRIGEGAIAVDMEASALATVARFRGARHGHAVYMADTLHGDEWDPTELIERDIDFRYRFLRAAASVIASR